jgi:hypothetical protein
MKNGFFIEAGAADGEDFSNTLFFELKRNVGKVIASSHLFNCINGLVDGTACRAESRVLQGSRETKKKLISLTKLLLYKNDVRSFSSRSIVIISIGSFQPRSCRL